MSVRVRGVRTAGSGIWTGPRVSFCILLAVCWLFVFTSGGKVPYGVFWVMALIPALSLVYAAITSLQLSARVSADGGAVLRGQTVIIECRLKNRGLLALWWAGIRLSGGRELMTDGKEHAFDMLPFETLRLRRPITPMHRGVYPFGVDRLAVGDIFNLVHIPVRRPPPAHLTVYPRVPEILPDWKKRLEPLTLGMRTSVTSDEPSVDARAYIVGDPMRRIHWNLTARKMELMTRLGESNLEQRLFCVIDLSPVERENALDIEDALVERCLSVVRHACRRQLDTTIVYGDSTKVLTMNGRTDGFYQKALEAMTRVHFSSRVPVSDLLSRTAGARLVMFFTVGVPKPSIMDMFPRGREAQICTVIDDSDGAIMWDPAGTGGVRITLLRLAEPADGAGGVP